MKRIQPDFMCDDGKIVTVVKRRHKDEPFGYQVMNPRAGLFPLIWLFEADEKETRWTVERTFSGHWI